MTRKLECYKCYSTKFEGPVHEFKLGKWIFQCEECGTEVEIEGSNQL